MAENVEWPISYKRNRVVISRGELNSGEEGGPIHSFFCLLSSKGEEIYILGAKAARSAKAVRS